MTTRRSPSSILAFFGTATLIAGAAADIDAGCLTNPDVCTILLSRNTPGGTLGFLSAPLTGRGASSINFDIASSNGADTSSVNWVAIPKNIGNALSSTFVNNASLRRGPSGLGIFRGSTLLVGGTKTVTGIPFRTGAKVFVMCSDIVTASGKLSVPDATVNATLGQFVINSNNGSDASLIDWVVIDQPLRFSPSGRLFSQSKGDLNGSTDIQFSGMNPLQEAVSVIASVITPAGTAGNLFSSSTRTDGNVLLASSNAADTARVEIAAF